MFLFSLQNNIVAIFLFFSLKENEGLDLCNINKNHNNFNENKKNATVHTKESDLTMAGGGWNKCHLTTMLNPN